MDAQTAARLLRGEAFGNRVFCPGPQHSAGDRSLTVTFTPNGFVVHTFSPADDWRACKDYVRSALGLPSSWRPDPNKIPHIKSDDAEKRRIALEIWGETKPLGGTVADKHLKSRGIRLSAEIPDIRFHRHLRYDGVYYPAMVALYRDIATNEPRGIHRTFIDGHGRKVDRKMLGSARMCAIKIDPFAPDLTIGEGIESCLSASEMGYPAVWSMMSAGGIQTLPPLPLDKLTVLGENDNGTSRKAALGCFRRMRCHCEYHAPDRADDFNGVLQTGEGIKVETFEKTGARA